MPCCRLSRLGSPLQGLFHTPRESRSVLLETLRREHPRAARKGGGGRAGRPPHLPQYQPPAPLPTARPRHAWESAAGWWVRPGWGTGASPASAPHFASTVPFLHGQVAHLCCVVFINIIIISNEKLKGVGGSGGGGGTHSPSASRGPRV